MNDKYISLHSGGLEKTTRASPHHMVQHQQDLRHHHLTLPEAADLAQNCPLWRIMLTYGARYAILELHARNDDDGDKYAHS